MDAENSCCGHTECRWVWPAEHSDALADAPFSIIVVPGAYMAEWQYSQRGNTPDTRVSVTGEQSVCSVIPDNHLACIQLYIMSCATSSNWLSCPKLIMYVPFVADSITQDAHMSPVAGDNCRRCIVYIYCSMQSLYIYICTAMRLSAMVLFAGARPVGKIPA